MSNNNFISFSFCCDDKKGIVKYFNAGHSGIIEYGEDNLMPQKLIEYYRKSPTNSGIINRKQAYTHGNNVTYSNPNAEGFIDSLDNGNGLNMLFSKLSLDYWLYGGFSLQIVWKQFQKEIAKIIYQDYSSVRLGYQDDDITLKVAIGNWIKNDKILWFEKFNGIEASAAPQFYYYSNYTPGMNYYPLPDYYSSVNSIKTEIDLIEYQQNIVSNGFYPSGFLRLPSRVAPEEKEEFKMQIKSEMAGASNAGKILTIFADGEETVEFIPVNNTPDDKSISEYIDQARQSILIGHSLPSGALIGLPTGASLQGDGNTLAIASKEFLNKIIIPAQTKIKKELEYLINLAGYSGEIIIEQNYPTVE